MDYLEGQLEKMRVAITGHSRGIGKAIADLYTDVKGFSRSNGYDIETVPEQIIKESLDCDVFINNAYSSDSQIKLFDLIFKHWSNDPNKTIVNVNSLRKYIKDLSTFPAYTANKKQLSNQTLAKMFTNKQCRVININPGAVETAMASNLPNLEKIQPEDVAQVVKWCLDQPQHIEIAEITVKHKRLKKG